MTTEQQRELDAWIAENEQMLEDGDFARGFNVGSKNAAEAIRQANWTWEDYQEHKKKLAELSGNRVSAPTESDASRGQTRKDIYGQRLSLIRRCYGDFFDAEFVARAEPRAFAPLPQDEISNIKACNESLAKLIDQVWEALEPTGEYEGDMNLVEFAKSVRIAKESSEWSRDGLLFKTASSSEPRTEIGKPCPTCGHEVMPEFGPGEYSCAACGFGMLEPCEHWKKMLAQPKPEDDDKALQEVEDLLPPHSTRISEPRRDEREAFEAWAKEEGFTNLRRSSESQEFYEESHLDTAWSAWAARASASLPQTPTIADATCPRCGWYLTTADEGQYIPKQCADTSEERNCPCGGERGKPSCQFPDDALPQPSAGQTEGK